MEVDKCIITLTFPPFSTIINKKEKRKKGRKETEYREIGQVIVDSVVIVVIRSSG